MTLGGYPRPQDADIFPTQRDALYARIKDLDEGSLFRAEDVVHTPEEIESFSAMRGYDYVHVVDGYFTGIVETAYLRRLPDRRKVLAAYAALRGATLADTGDRIAWQCRLKEWEPILGYRYYTDKCEEVLSFGRMKIQIVSAPAWLRDESAPARLFRAFLDLPAKDRQVAFTRLRTHTHLQDSDIRAAIEWAQQQDMSETPFGEDPLHTLLELTGLLREHEAA